MRNPFYWSLMLAALWLPSTQAAELLGNYESARSVDDERVQLRLFSQGKAQIIAEHNFLMPGDETRRRGRTTSYGKWTSKAGVVTLTYSNIQDRLRYSPTTSRASVGLEGGAPGLVPIKPVSPKSRLKGVTLWKAPHDYRMKATDATPVSPPISPGPGEPGN